MIINWRRFLKRRNCSPNTVKNYLNALKHFVIWLDVPIEDVTHTNVSWYIDYLMAKRLKPKTINCHLNSIRQFYHYMREEEHMQIPNPIRKNHALRMSRPLPRRTVRQQESTEERGLASPFPSTWQNLWVEKSAWRARWARARLSGLLLFFQKRV